MSCIVRDRRDLIVDIYDYSGNKICPLYDSRANIEGQATDVVIVTERNGWKELSFNIPSDDYRVQYLIADYKLKVIENDGEQEPFDWYLMTKPATQHNGKRKTVSVTAGHVSQLLKTKNLGLEFSDTEGNNVGTATQLLEAVLDGTGWSVSPYTQIFYEDKVDAEGRQVEKIRSLTASAKTGAFKLISNICDLFEAKPVYHGWNRTVELKTLNPFAKMSEAQIIASVDPTNVLELHYGHNIKTMTRTYNSENLVTKLYAYGAYGKANDEGGYCGIDECSHTEYTFTLSEDLDADTEYWFTLKDSTGVTIYRSFTPTNSIATGSELVYSELDPASTMYIYNKSHAENEDCAWFLSEGMNGTELPAAEPTIETVKNMYSFLLDFSYFREAKLFTQEMLNRLGKFQYEALEYLQEINELSAIYATDYVSLTDTIGIVNYAKLNVNTINEDDGHLKLFLDEDEKVIYRTDYYEKEDKYFKWRKASSIKDNGDPMNPEAAVIYAIQCDVSGGEKVPTGIYEKFYIKSFDNEDDPYELTLFAQYVEGRYDDYDFYIFESNSINGLLGAYEAFDEAASMELESSTTNVTVKHPVIFSKTEPVIQRYDPEFDYPVPSWVTGYNAQYAWWWKYEDDYDTTESELYFCYMSAGDTSWKRVFVGETEELPTGGSDGDYYYNIRKAKLYRKESEWIYLDSDEDVRTTMYFSTVYMYCQKKDMYHKGLYKKYKAEMEVTSDTWVAITDDDPPSDFATDYKRYYHYDSASDTYIPYIWSDSYDPEDCYKFFGYTPNNYYMADPYGNYWCFTSNMNATEFVYDTTDGFVTEHLEGSSQIDDTVPVKTVNFTAVKYHPENIFADTTYERGTINEEGGDEQNDSYYRTEYCQVYPNMEYEFTRLIIPSAESEYIIHCYTARHTQIGDPITVNLSTTDPYTFRTSNSARYIRVTSSNDLRSVQLLMYTPDYDKTIIVGEYNETYYRLECEPDTESTYKALNAFIRDFYTMSDKVYMVDLPAVETAQNAYNEYDNAFKDIVGDMYREGYWQKADYVDGDEEKLYSDALDNLKQISKPEVSYNIDYIDLSCMKINAIEEDAVKWPDFDTDVGVHIVDEEIGVNCWAYLDKLSKCYDDPARTSISINTNLTTCAQHSFTDVMTNIANVAAEVKGKVQVYDRAAIITGSGTIPSTAIEGTINTDTTSLSGCSSTWYTDKDGNVVFETVDGQSAMKITGSGFCISNGRDKYGDWIWQTFGNGNGFNAAAITTGFLNAERIRAGGISTRELSADSVTAEQLAAGSVTAETIAAGSIKGRHIESETITTDKVSNDFGTSLTLTENAAIVDANERIAFVVTKDPKDPTKFEITDAGMSFIGSNIEAKLPPDGQVMGFITGAGQWIRYNAQGLIIGQEVTDPLAVNFASRMANNGFYIHNRTGNISAPVEDTEVVGKFVATGLNTRGVKIGDLIASKTSTGGWVWQIDQN